MATTGADMQATWRQDRCFPFWNKELEMTVERVKQKTGSYTRVLIATKIITLLNPKPYGMFRV